MLQVLLQPLLQPPPPRPHLQPRTLLSLIAPASLGEVRLARVTTGLKHPLKQSPGPPMAKTFEGKGLELPQVLKSNVHFGMENDCLGVCVCVCILDTFMLHYRLKLRAFPVLGTTGAVFVYIRFSVLCHFYSGALLLSWHDLCSTFQCSAILTSFGGELSDKSSRCCQVSILIPFWLFGMKYKPRPSFLLACIQSHGL